jgi:lipopolysaccharide biosynthesis regulator YciM
MSRWWDLPHALTSPFTVGLVALCVVGALLLVSLRRRRLAVWRQGQRPFPPPTQPFERGFDLLLDDRWQEAIEVLKTAVRTDPDCVLAYLELGKLCRRRGDPGRAARLLEHLLARPSLGRDERLLAQYELGLAYRDMALHEHAAAALRQVLQAAPAYPQARRELRRTYEELGRWEQAVAVERVRLKRGEATDAQTLAALRTQQGKAAWAAGQLRQGAAHLRAALALDPDCTEAALLLGRLWLRRGKPRRALRVWDGLARRRPEFLYLAFRDMQASFRQLHDEAAWEGFLAAFTQRHPNDPMGHLALAEWCMAQGRGAEAAARLRRALELEPRCREAHLALLALYRQQGVPSEVLETYERLAHSAAGQPCGGCRCRGCGHTSAEPFWKCPRCAVWATPERLMPDPSRVPIPGREMSPAIDQTPGRPAASDVVVPDTPVQPPEA